MPELVFKDPWPGTGPNSPSTPISAYTPSPLTPTGTRPRLGPRRQSRFTEDMTDRTPVASISDQSLDNYWYGPSAENVNTDTNITHSLSAPNMDATPAKTPRNWRMWLRLLNGVFHVALCVALLAFLGYGMRALKKDPGSYMIKQAIVLICFLSLDILLDIFTLIRVQYSWPPWGLALRSLCGICYFTCFLVYIALGSAFPNGQTYWGLSPDSAAALLYILLCIQGLWNLLHIPVSRYHPTSPFKKNNKKNTTTKTSPISRNTTTAAAAAADTINNTNNNNRSTTTFNPRLSVAGTEHSSISLTWRNWIRTRSSRSRDDLAEAEAGFFHRPPSADRTLRGDERQQPGGQDERKGKEKEEDEVGGRRGSRGTSSHSYGSQGEKMDGEEKWLERGRGDGRG